MEHDEDLEPPLSLTTNESKEDKSFRCLVRDEVEENSRLLAQAAAVLKDEIYANGISQRGKDSQQAIAGPESKSS